MEGKKIIAVEDLDKGYQFIKLDDGQVMLVKIISEDISEILSELGGEPEKNKESEKEETQDKVPEPEGDGYTGEDLMAMDHGELSELCKDNDLDTDPDDFGEDEVDNFRKNVAEEIDVKLPEPAKDKKPEVDDSYTKADIKAMDYDELSELCDEEDLDTDPDDFGEDEEKALRKAIIKELGL